MSLWLIAILASLAPFVSSLTVDLSQRGLKKEEFFVKIQNQINLKEVTELILWGNEFDSFLDCSTNLASLKTLDLSQNHLQRFFFLCKEEYNLAVLNVSYNKLEYIDDNALNNRIPKLKILDLSNNKLSVVNETMLEHLKALEYLSLSNNPIGDGIHENAFWNVRALKHLDLRNVSAPDFSPEFFKTLTNLSTLDLSWNPIKTVPLLPPNLEELDLSGTHVAQLYNFYLPQLRELRLNSMQSMRLFAFNDLENLTSLESLSLAGSKRLAHLKLWAHSGPLLPRLQRLSIRDCALQTLGSDLRLIMQRPSALTLLNNPWNCDCRMAWLDSDDSAKAIGREIKCASPPRHTGKLLSEIPNEELECEYVSTVFYPALWSSVSILLVACTLVMAFLLFRRPLGNWDVRRRNRDTVTYTNVVESSNDLVRILSVGESIDRNDD